MASICWHMHLACILPVLWSSFMCHGSAVSCGINIKLWRDSEKFIIQRNHKKTTLPLLSSPLPPPLFIHRKERYCFPSNPPPHQTLSLTHAQTRAQYTSGIEPSRSQILQEWGREERTVGAEAHRTRCILDNTDTRQNHHRPSLCRLNKGICVHLCVSTRKEGRYSDGALFSN